MTLRRLAIWSAASLVGLAALYVALLLGAFMNARDMAYFSAHPEEHRKVLEDCRAGRGWFPECEEAEAIAPDR